MTDGTTEWIFDVTDATFESDVIRRSFELPVVVDFWAPWCGPCRTLGPLLERLTTEAAGAFVLAKVNVDESSRVAQAFAIQGIPAVKVIRDGRLIDEFTGALPEPQVRAFLARLMPTGADRLAARAAGTADPEESEALYRQALAEDVNHPGARLGLARLVLERDREAGLEELEKVLPGTPERQEADRLAASVRMQGAPIEGEADLRARLEADPADLDARLELGRALAAGACYEAALEELLEVVRRDRRHQDEGARRAMLDVFEVLGAQHPLTERFRGELARVLFS